jgi:hypothetical protein
MQFLRCKVLASMKRCSMLHAGYGDADDGRYLLKVHNKLFSTLAGFLEVSVRPALVVVL